VWVKGFYIYQRPSVSIAACSCTYRLQQSSTNFSCENTNLNFHFRETYNTLIGKGTYMKAYLHSTTLYYTRPVTIIIAVQNLSSFVCRPHNNNNNNNTMNVLWWFTGRSKCNILVKLIRCLWILGRLLRNCCRAAELCLIRRDGRYVDGGRRNILKKRFPSRVAFE